MKATQLQETDKDWKDYQAKHPSIKPLFNMSDPDRQAVGVSADMAEARNIAKLDPATGGLAVRPNGQYEGHLGEFIAKTDNTTAGIRSFFDYFNFENPNLMYNELMYALIVDAEAEFLKDVVHPEIVKQLEKAEQEYGGLGAFYDKLRGEIGEENIRIIEGIYGMSLEAIIPFLKANPVKLVGGEVRPHTADAVSMEARILANKGITVITPKEYSDSTTIYMYSFLTHILGACGATHITCSHSSNYVMGRKALAPDGSQLLADMYEHYRNILLRNITNMMKGEYQLELAADNDPRILKALDYDNMARLYKTIVNLSQEDIDIINEATKNGHRVVLNSLNGATWKTLEPLIRELGINPEAFDLVLAEEDRFFNAGFTPTRSLELMERGKEWLGSGGGAKIAITEEDWRAVRLKVKDAGMQEEQFIVDNELKAADFLVVKKDDGQYYIVRKEDNETIAQLAHWVYSVDHMGIDTTIGNVIASIPYRYLLKGKPVGTKVYECDPDSDRYVVKQIMPNEPSVIKLIESFGLDYYDLGDEKILVAFSPNKTFLQLDIVDYELLKEKGLLDKYILLYLITYVSTEAWGEFADSPKVEMTKVMAMVGFKNLTTELQRLIEAWWYDEMDSFSQDLLRANNVRGTRDELIFEDQLGFTVTIRRVNDKEIRFHAKEEESGGRVGPVAQALWNLLGRRVLAMPEKSSADALFSELLFSSKSYMDTYRSSESTERDAEDILAKSIKGDYSILRFLDRKFRDYGMKSRIDLRFDILHANQGIIKSLPFEQQQIAMERCAAEKANFNNLFFSLGNAVREGKADIKTIQQIFTAVLPQYRDTWMALSEMTVTWERLAGGKRRPEGVPMYFRGEGQPLVTALKARPSGTDVIKSKIYLDAIQMLLSTRKGLEEAFNGLTEYDLYPVLEHYGIESVVARPAILDEVGLRRIDMTDLAAVERQPGLKRGEGTPARLLRVAFKALRKGKLEGTFTVGDLVDIERASERGASESTIRRELKVVVASGLFVQLPEEQKRGNARVYQFDERLRYLTDEVQLESMIKNIPLLGQSRQLSGLVKDGNLSALQESTESYLSVLAETGPYALFDMQVAEAYLAQTEGDPDEAYGLLIEATALLESLGRKRVGLRTARATLDALIAHYQTITGEADKVRELRRMLKTVDRIEQYTSLLDLTKTREGGFLGMERAAIRTDGILAIDVEWLDNEDFVKAMEIQLDILNRLRKKDKYEGGIWFVDRHSLQDRTWAQLTAKERARREKVERLRDSFPDVVRFSGTNATFQLDLSVYGNDRDVLEIRHDSREDLSEIYFKAVELSEDPDSIDGHRIERDAWLDPFTLFRAQIAWLNDMPVDFSEIVTEHHNMRSVLDILQDKAIHNLIIQGV